MNNKREIVTGVSLAAVLVAAAYFIFTTSQTKEVSNISETQKVDPIQETEVTLTPEAVQETQELSQYTTEEVALHASPEDCWVIINSNVYDLSNFSSKHPGGPAPIEFNCGKDGTQGFTTRGGKGEHPQRAQDTLKSFFIGTVRE